MVTVTLGLTKHRDNEWNRNPDGILNVSCIQVDNRLRLRDYPERQVSILRNMRTMPPKIEYFPLSMAMIILSLESFKIITETLKIKLVLTGWRGLEHHRHRRSHLDTIEGSRQIFTRKLFQQAKEVTKPECLHVGAQSG